MALDITLYILSALTGLAIGSFLNVCIYRLPRGEFFSRARSYCPKCSAPIRARDNIPLISYIVLRGKCRSCGQPISPRYPVVEALTAALFVANFAYFGVHPLTIVWDIAVCALITAAFIDLDTFEIPDSAILVLLVLGAVTFAPFGGVSWQDKLIGCACVSVPMLIVCLLGGMGFGDVKLYFVLGLLLGWQKTLVLFLFSAVLGAAGSLIVVAVRKRKAGGEGEDAADNIPESSTDPDTISEETTDHDRATDGSTDPYAISEDMTNFDIVRDETTGSGAISEDMTNSDKMRDETTDIDASALNAAKIEQTPEEDTPSDKNRGKARIFFKKRGEEGEEREDAFTRAAKRGSAVPFGPFIALATVVALYGGDAIISFYARILGL